MTRDWQQIGTCATCGAAVYVARDGSGAVAYECFCRLLQENPACAYTGEMRAREGEGKQLTLMESEQ